jgi:hypothetical protein
MAIDNFFAHRNPNNLSHPNARVREAGYELPDILLDSNNDVELITAGIDLDAPLPALQSLLQSPHPDTPSTRENRLSPLLGDLTPFNQHHEIGVGFHQSDSSSLKNYWVVASAHQHAGDRFLTGVAFVDLNDNLRYDVGEGLANVVVTNGQHSATTDTTGAYRLAVSAGVHDVRANDPLTESHTQVWVAVDAHNVQVDFRFETLGSQHLLSSSPTISPQINFRQRTLWTNYFHHLDANNNGTLEPLDALLIINRLNRQGPANLSLAPGNTDESRVDTNGDGRLTPMDALLVINHLNRTSSARAGEGEGSPFFAFLSRPFASNKREHEKLIPCSAEVTTS